MSEPCCARGESRREVRERKESCEPPSLAPHVLLSTNLSEKAVFDSYDSAHPLSTSRFWRLLDMGKGAGKDFERKL